MLPVGEATVFAKKTYFGATMAIKQWRRLCLILGGKIWLRQGVCGYVFAMRIMDEVGNGGGGRVELFGSGGQGKRNGWQQDDHQ